MTHMGNDLVYAGLKSESLRALLWDLVPDTWRIYARGTLGKNGVPAQPEYPYVIYGMGESNRARVVKDTAPRTFRRDLYVFVYDQPGSFERIKQIHALIQDNVIALAGQSATDGSRIVDVEFDGLMQEVYDQISDNNVMQGVYSLLVNAG